MMVEQEQAIFENAGQAVHVAFLVMAQEAMQDAPFRKALIRVMESINLDRGQTHWLDQLRGEKSGAINFEGLSGGEVRAQCALITQAVKTNLPSVERWVLQAKYGETDYEDVIDHGQGETAAAVELERATAKLHAAKEKLQKATCTDTNFMRARLAAAESAREVAKVAFDQVSACRMLDNGPMPKGQSEGGRRRYAFSAERIAAITGLSDYFQPMFPRIKPFAIDVMLGRLFANHKKLDISTRDMAAQFGGNYKMYLRAGWKMKNQVREIEQLAMTRLEPVFIDHGVIGDPARDTL